MQQVRLSLINNSWKYLIVPVQEIIIFELPQGFLDVVIRFYINFLCLDDFPNPIVNVWCGYTMAIG